MYNNDKSQGRNICNYVRISYIRFAYWVDLFAYSQDVSS